MCCRVSTRVVQTCAVALRGVCWEYQKGDTHEYNDTYARARAHKARTFMGETAGTDYTVGKVGTFTALVRIWGWFVAKRAMAESLVADAGEAV